MKADMKPEPKSLQEACFRFAWRDHCTPARGQPTLRPAPPMQQRSRLGLPRWRRKLRTPGKRAQPKSNLCDRVVDSVTDLKIGCAPERSAIPSGAELLGAMTSLGPSRECYKPSRKSRGRPTPTAGAPAPLPAVSAQRM